MPGCSSISGRKSVPALGNFGSSTAALRVGIWSSGYGGRNGNWEKVETSESATAPEQTIGQLRFRRWGQKEEDAMSTSKKPLKPDDFPVNAEGQKIKKQDGTPIANTEDPAVAADVAERLNDDEARREDDKWSA